MSVLNIAEVVAAYHKILLNKTGGYSGDGGDKAIKANETKGLSVPTTPKSCTHSIKAVGTGFDGGGYEQSHANKGFSGFVPTVPTDFTKHNIFDLLQHCQGLGLVFEVVGDGESLTINGNLEALDESTHEAIASARDELLALVFCQANGLEYGATVDVSQHLELRRLINELCDKAPHGKAGREAMLESSLTMRAMNVPHCIEHYRRCLRDVASGTYWSFKQDGLQDIGVLAIAC
jgi:hypothetical protein